MRHLSTFRRNRSGASVLEFALVVPVFFAIMFGIVDLGRYLLTRHSLSTLVSATARAIAVNCGADGTNYGKLNSGCASMTAGTSMTAGSPIYGLNSSQVQQEAPFISGQSPTVSASCGSCPLTGGQITITASISSFTFFLPVAGIIPGWSAAAAEKAMTDALTQTATLYY